jgi:hypothetical protein
MSIFRLSTFVAIAFVSGAAGFLTARIFSLSPLSGYTSAPAPARTATSSADQTPQTSIAHAASQTWDSLRTAPASPVTENARVSALTQLAAQDPEQAITLALEAPSPRERDLFPRAALQGWASRDATAAAKWMLANVRAAERRSASEALVEGAIAEPTNATRAIEFLCEADPSLTSEHGNLLVTALARAGHFEFATSFAVKGPSDYRGYWLSTAFIHWAQYDAHAAIGAAQSIADASARDEALHGVIVGWARHDPAALVAYSANLPAGETRTAALRDGLQEWVHLDPAAASAWMDQLDPSRDLDHGAAAVATMPAIVEHRPDIAVSWAESIVDPQLRADTLLDLVRLWATIDPQRARAYATSSPTLSPETRRRLLAAVEH